MLDKAKDQADRNMDIIQDAAAIDQEMDYQQQQLQDLISQQTAKMTEDLDDEYDKLGDLELLEAMDDYDVDQKHVAKDKAPAQQNKAKPAENSYDNLLADLLN